MFRCQMCHTVVPARTRSAKVVIATRGKVYEPRGQDPRERVGRGFRGRRPRKRKPYDKGGVGTEIVRELAVCPNCAAEHASSTPEHIPLSPEVNVDSTAYNDGDEAESST